MNEPKKLLRSFGYGAKGILYGIRTQRNLRIHLCALVTVIWFDGMAGFSLEHWCLELLCCMAVISLELMNTALEALCDRCLTPLELPVDRTVSHTVVRTVNGEDDETFLVAEDGFVELLELATNDILPELPQRYLCREDCKGLCPACGKNLNEGPCACHRESGDPRLDALRRLLEN